MIEVKSYQLWYLRYIVFLWPASMTMRINLLSKISMIARYSPVLIEYNPLALPFRGPSFSRGFSRSSSSARAISIEILTGLGSLVRSCSAPAEMTTLYQLKSVPEFCHYFFKRFASSSLEIFSGFFDSLKGLIAQWLIVNVFDYLKKFGDNSILCQARGAAEGYQLLIGLFTQRHCDSHADVLSSMRHMHSYGVEL